MPHYILYELVPRRNDPGPSFSPDVWPVKLAMESLGIAYERRPMTFTQIRSELVEKTGNPKVTVPTLEVDGEYITDSWVIAEYLDKTFGLFRSDDEKRYARFLDHYKDSVMDHLVPVVMSKIYESLDDSRDYFRNTKIGPEALDSWAALERDDELFNKQCRLARDALQPIEKALSGSDYLGVHMGHPDYVLFGAYAWTRMSPRAVKETWEHDTLPNIQRWIKSMLASGLVTSMYLHES